jgi:hypothetical protein
MAADKSKRVVADRSKVAPEQNHEVRHLAEKFGLSTDQGTQTAGRCGHSRRIRAR